MSSFTGLRDRLLFQIRRLLPLMFPNAVSWALFAALAAQSTAVRAQETLREIVIVDTDLSVESDTTWLGGKLYWVQADLTVVPGRTLTIEDDVIVRFAPGTGVTVQGILNAGDQGVPLTTSIGITLTSQSDDTAGGDLDGTPTSVGSPGAWNGLQILANGSAELSDTTIHFAGNGVGAVLNENQFSLFGGGISDSSGAGVYSASALSITESDFRQNSGAAVQLTGPYAVNGSDITVSSNGVDAIVYPATAVTATLPLQNLGLPIRLDGTLTVNADATLTIGAGVQLEIATGTSIEVSGILTATGTAANPITMTAVSGTWGRLSVGSGGAAALTEVTLQNSGSCDGCTGATVEVEAAAVGVTLDSVRFSGHADVPLRAALTAPLTLRKLSAASGLGAIELYGTSLTTTVTLASPGLPYWLEDDLTVGSGGRLTLDPGVTLALNGSGVLATTGSGEVRAVGTAAQPITVTAQSGTTAGSWGHVAFSGSGASRLEHVTLQYGGAEVAPTYTDTLSSSELVTGSLRLLGAPATVLSSTIVNGQGAAVTADAAQSLILAGLSATGNTVNAIVLKNLTLSSTTPVTYSWSAAGLAYLLDEDLRLNSGATVEIQGGSVVKIKANGRLFVSGGQLLTRGVSVQTQPVIFTSVADDTVGGNADGLPSTGASGNWGYFFITNSASESEFVGTVFRYGGGYVGASALPGVIRLSGSAAPRITDSQFISNTGSAVRATATNFPVVTGTSFAGNGIDGIEMIGGTLGGTGASVQGVLASRGVTYTLTGHYTVALDATLVISRGVVLEIGANKVLVANRGAIQFSGESGQPITVTSIADSTVSADNWGHVALIDAAEGSRVVHTTFKNAGAFNNGTLDYYPELDSLSRSYEGILRIVGSSAPLVRNVTFRGAANWPIHQDFSARPQYSDVTWGEGPAVVNVAAVPMNQVGGVRTWQSGLTYRVADPIMLTDIQTLVVESGTVVKFGPQGGFDLENASLTASGSQVAPVIFTSVCDVANDAGSYKDTGCNGPQAGDWGFIGLRGLSTANLQSTLVRYGGGLSTTMVAEYGACSGCAYGVFRLSGSSLLTPTLVLSQSVVSYSAAYAVSADIYSTLDTDTSAFTDNEADAIELRAATYAPFAVFSTRLDVTEIPYVIGPEDSVLSLGSAVRMSVDPGVSLEFLTNTALNVDGGQLTMLGTAANPITLTARAQSPNAGAWGHVRLNGTSSATSRFHHVTLSYGGFYRGNAYESLCFTCEYDGTLRLDGTASVELDHVRLLDGAGSAVSVDRSAFPVLGASQFITATGNELDAIEVRGASIYSSDSAQTIQWQIPGIPYIPVDHVRFGDNISLELSPGVEVRMRPGKNIGLFGSARIDAVGTAEQPIVFTSVEDNGIGTPESGDWGHLAILDSRTENRLENVVLRYGGAYVSTGADFYPTDGSYHACTTCAVLDGPIVVTLGKVTIKDVTISDNRGAAVVSDIGSHVNFSDTVRLLGNGQNLVLIRTSSTEQTSRPPAVQALIDAITVTQRAIGSTNETEDRLVYRIAGDVTVANSAGLTVESGAVLKFDLTAGLTVNSGGRLTVTADVAQPRTVFTSIRDDSIAGDTNQDGTDSQPGAGNWDGMTIGSGARLSLTRADLRYAGTALSVAATQSGVTLSELLISSNTNGIDASSAPGLIIRDSDFLENTSLALRGPLSGNPISAGYNYWDGPDGPRTSATVAGNGGVISGLVDFVPFYRDIGHLTSYSPFIYIPLVTR